MVEFVTREISHEARNLNSWAANVHAGDHTHNANSVHTWSLADRSWGRDRLALGRRRSLGG